MTREELKRHFPEGLVFGHREIAAYESKRYERYGGYPTGKRIDFDAAYDILGHDQMEEALEKGSAILIRHQGDEFYYRKLVEAVEGKK